MSKKRLHDVHVKQLAFNSDLVEASTTVSVRLVSSVIGVSKKQKATIQALGIRKVGQVVRKVLNKPLLGMLCVVSHLVEVTDLGNVE